MEGADKEHDEPQASVPALNTRAAGEHRTRMRVVMPRRADVRQHLADDAPQDRNRIVQPLPRRTKALGEALVYTSEGTPAEPSRPQRNALEGPRWSSDKLPLGADFWLCSAGMAETARAN